MDKIKLMGDLGLTEDMLKEYEHIRTEGKTNMLDYKVVEKLSGKFTKLNAHQIKIIITHYTDLSNFFPEILR